VQQRDAQLSGFPEIYTGQKPFLADLLPVIGVQNTSRGFNATSHPKVYVESWRNPSDQFGDSDLVRFID
jgi:hypothetical protein